MVSYDPRRLVGTLVEETSLLARGAESELRLGRFYGRKAVFKLRLPKPYMDPALDSKLRRVRTIREAKVIAAALEGGVPAPRLYMVLPSAGLIVMEYVEGPQLKEVLWRGSLDPGRAGYEAGVILGRLHSLGIVHGDPTTSNYIVSGRGLILIDYGLSEFSTSIEDRAVDVHLFKRAVESTHAGIVGELYGGFLDGYRESMGDPARGVLERVEEIELRGRYVEERRKSVWRM
ncbi:MAG: Kae1-associated kinase Bud32 [Desulfurococcales archaeon]|nr:Kae1-associated kinase Bud32 [Desulfurococcales archaeon]MCE4626872.1 Kae1-associated kinase Bud32 [Desulfurococcales archaeon]MCE4629753.1 Kae1-associated kinase Bud32 [Desulfurococcales archaeon]